MTKKPTTSKGPARGYQWPPFEPGNTASVTHGARSERVLSPIAEQIAASLAEVAPWTTRASFAASITAWSFAEAQCIVYRRHFDDVGLFEDEDDRQAGVAPRPGLDRWDRAEARAARLRKSLGLDPAAMATLLAATAQLATVTGDRGTLDQLEAEGREVMRLYSGKLAAPVPEPPSAALPSATGTERAEASDRRSHGQPGTDDEADQ